MRADQFLSGAQRDFEVLPVVIPVAGTVQDAAGGSFSRGLTVQIDAGSGSRSGSVELLADPRWRARLARAQPLPRLARAASPGLVNTVSRQITDAFASAARGAPVHVMRSYLAPLGLAVAEGLGAPWTTLDLDDDDASFERARGQPSESEAFERLVRTFAPSFSAVAAASPTDASNLSDRSGIDVVVVPNAVAIPSHVVRDPPDHPEILFVGNLTYAPNMEAAEALVFAILPRLRRSLSTSVSLTMVGAYEPDGRLASVKTQPGVQLTGAVPDLVPYYARASLVVAPLPPGGGTKIKILEAFAHRVPVVTTPPGTAGLDVTDGIEVLIGGDVEALVQRASQVLLDPVAAHRVADRAFDYVSEHHAPTVAARAVQRLLASAARSGAGPDGAIG